MLDRVRRSTLPLAVFVALACAACGADAPDATAPTSDAPRSDAPADRATQEADPVPPGGDVDWATVDVTTIDWATIDMSTVDFDALRDNPTIADLDAETTKLIGSRMDRGSAVLTIGDEVWEFDAFDCVLGHEHTRSETYSFTTNSFATFAGIETQLQVTIADPSSTGQVTGDETVHRVDFDDIGNLEDPALDWSLTGHDAIRIDGRTVTVEGSFDDETTPGADESVPGTLEGTCSADSRLSGG